MKASNMTIAAIAASLAIIDNYDFSKVVDRAVRDGTLTAGDAPQAVDELKAFFAACARKEMDLTPQSQQCDALWHAFILKTRSYAAFCDQAFGGFLHHETDADDESLAAAHANSERVLGVSTFSRKAECGDIRRECGDIRRVECGDIRRVECGDISKVAA